jgi:hypothetical protein
MTYRILGGTGIEVSAYCLGTMMFGADGNPDHGDSIQIIHAALGWIVFEVEESLRRPPGAGPAPL